MPLIKDLPNTDKPFIESIKYFKSTFKENDMEFFCNTGLVENNTDLVRAFIKNSKYKRKHLKSSKHIIISFSPKDEEAINKHPEILRDMIHKVLEIRGYNKGVLYGLIHRNTSHIHFHGLVSSNHFQSGKSLRNDFDKYLEQNKKIEQYQQEKYGHILKHSYAYIDKDRPKDKKQKRTRNTKDRDYVIEKFNEIADLANDLTNFYDLVEAKYPSFQRYETTKGRINGCTYNSRKYRIISHLDRDKYELLLELEEMRENNLFHNRNHQQGLER